MMSEYSKDINNAYDSGFSDGIYGAWNNPYPLNTELWAAYEEGNDDGAAYFFYKEMPLYE